eukprot:CAMPEP_0171157804 /NCGR_PEP_ID=MMETSP0790-20130122/2159_1 /TAXON_ID=2925 /ORGANISM="Alexandrium catenella, Strain OF101" /LENGTH=399 /DNA_ID=CAMNT_0011622175 /DNA_START=347 /DNA_END=1546 /DNA_ORIENTATION=+
MKGVEDSIREGISELYWGELRTADSKTTWEWVGTGPSIEPPALSGKSAAAGSKCCNYRQYVKTVIKDSADRKKLVRTWELLDNLPVQGEMGRLLEVAMERMELQPGLQDCKDAKAAGVAGRTYNMLPSFFHLVAALQLSGRSFAVLFRSFGADHEKVKNEWNAFCELRHPLFSRLIEEMGPWDGTDPAIPDRRIHSVHTLYRDHEGPMLILDCFTNGPKEASWDSWAKKKPAPEGPPQPQDDTRQGREYVKEVLKAKTVQGFSGMQSWLRNHLVSQSTASIKDDWAWWHAHNEVCFAGKVLPLISGGTGSTRQVFFDDNIELDDPRIVDCRDPDGGEIPAAKSLSRLCVKVNPIEALLNKDYFLQKLRGAESQACLQQLCDTCHNPEICEICLHTVCCA